MEEGERKRRNVFATGLLVLLGIFVFWVYHHSSARSWMHDRPCDHNLIRLSRMLLLYASDQKLNNTAVFNEAGLLVTNRALIAQYTPRVTGKGGWGAVGEAGVPICDLCGKTYAGRTSPPSPTSALDSWYILSANTRPTGFPASTSMVYVVIWDQDYCHMGKRLALLSNGSVVALSPRQFSE